MVKRNYGYLEVEIVPNGLWLRLTNEGRQELANMSDNLTDTQKLFELLSGPNTSGMLQNGWHSLTAEQVGGLTGCEIILADDVAFDDLGEVVALGATYWHERYAIESPTAALESCPSGGLFLLKA